MKICDLCLSEKPLNYFGYNHYAKDKINTICKKCVSLARKTQKRIEKETEFKKILAIQRLPKPCKIAKRSVVKKVKRKKIKKPVPAHPLKVTPTPKFKELKLKKLKFYKFKFKRKKFSLKNIRRKPRVKKSKLHHKQRQRKYVKTRLKEDVCFRITNNIRSRMSAAFRGKNKSKSTLALLGCNMHYLKNHLQQQFKEGMTFKNYGEWEIDHIKPMSTFNLFCIGQQMKCCHYSNLQPLWRRENRSKCNRYEGPYLEQV